MDRPRSRCARLLARLAIHKSTEPESLAVCIDFDQLAGLLADEPEGYNLTDHYLNHPVVLVRLSRIWIDQLRDLLKSALRFIVAQKSQRTPRPSARRKRQDGQVITRPAVETII